MAWTAYLGSRAKGANAISVEIVYSDGISQKFSRSYEVQLLDDATVIGLAQTEVARLEAVAKVADQLTLQDGAQLV